MAEIRMSTAGMKLLYAVETEAGVRPTTGYKEVPEVTEMPEISSDPETLDATPLSATRYRIYIPSLIDLGGALSYTANFSQEELNVWNKTIVPAYEAAIKDGKNVWFCIYIPGFEDAVYYTAQPTKIGAPGATVGEVLRINLPLTPSNEPDWYPIPTDISEMSVSSASQVRVTAKKNTEVDV